MLITKNVYQFGNTELPWKNVKTSKPRNYVSLLVLFESREYSGDIDLQYCCAFYNGEDFMAHKMPFEPNRKLNYPVVAYLELDGLKHPKRVEMKSQSLF